jgi:hypothetical protein
LFIVASISPSAGVASPSEHPVNTYDLSSIASSGMQSHAHAASRNRPSEEAVMGHATHPDSQTPIDDPYVECVGIDRLVLEAVNGLTDAPACRRFVSPRDITDRCNDELQGGWQGVPEPRELVVHSA